MLATVDAGQPGQPRGVLVLGVDVHSVLFQDGIEIIDPLPVFLIGRGLDPDDGVDRFAAGVDQSSDRELQLADQGVLLLQIHVVGFHQGEAEVGDVAVLHALTVERVEADPGTGFLVVVAQDGADVAVAALQRLDQLAGSPVIVALCREMLAVPLE